MSSTVKLHYQEFGRENVPVIVILHGFFASSRNWRAIAKKLSESFHVYVPDLRNHGQSPHVQEMGYPSMAADVEAFMREHKIEKACLLGHSMGGKVAMWTALNYPKLVEKLVIVDIAPVTYQHGFENIIEALQDLPLEQIKNRKQADELLSELLPDTNFRQFLLQNLILKDGEYMWRVDLDVFKKSAPEIIAFPYVENVNPFPRESLFLVGGKSKHVEKIHYELICKLFPNAIFKIIAEAGHWLHAEQPEYFLAILRGFFSDCS